jgi:hypothetical protein
VRTHKRWTFEMLNHHETHVALDAAQGCPHLKKREKQAKRRTAGKSMLRFQTFNCGFDCTGQIDKNTGLTGFSTNLQWIFIKLTNNRRTRKNGKNT